MIPSGITSDDRAGAVTAAGIGQQPFLVQELIEIIGVDLESRKADIRNSSMGHCNDNPSVSLVRC